MKHGVKAKHFNRDTKSRKALLRNSLRGLIEYGYIETSESRAKEVRRLADKLINKAKKADLNARRQIQRFFGKRDVTNTLVDQIAPAMQDRRSGFCSLTAVNNRRGDNMPVFRLSLLVKEKTWTSLNNDKKVSEVKKTEVKHPAATSPAKKSTAKTPAKKATAKKLVTKKSASKKEDKK